MKKLALLGMLAIAVFAAGAARSEPLVPQDAQPYSADLLARVRAAAATIPGALPTRINYLKLAESHRPMADIIEGGSQANYISARTAFQVVYPSGSVMVDSGMDQAVHKFFGFGREEPFWPERNAAVQQALKQASLIVITHEHGDHVAGVIRSDARKEIAAKTLLTREQVRTLTLYPQMPEIRLTPELARDYIVVDYDSHLPVAPGMVLIKAPGHTPGHQMVYVRLDSGREYLLIGDVGWTLDNVSQLKLRPAATMRRISEDASALMHQLRWIKGAMDQDKLVVIPSHDDKLLQELAAKTMLTREQVRTLTLYPQMPEIRLTPELARDYIVVDYDSHLPIAPGMVLIKAPGHTPGHQMVYVRLDSGREYLLIGDVGWTLDNVSQLKLRPAATMRRISEDASALMHQLRWIKGVMDQDKLVVIPSHDDKLLQELAAKQLIGELLLLR